MNKPRSDSDRLAALWDWLSTWVAPDGGVYGPVVHRFDLKRLATLHDTAWTQSAVIRGLLHLHRRSGRDYWLARALRLADAQCARQEPSGRFARAGHEDNRFSALVHNALADCALLDAATAAREEGDARRAERYLRVVEANVAYLVEALYRPALGGFAMDTYDYYAGRDRLVVNMNSVAADALVRLDEARDESRHASLVETIGERIAVLQATEGDADGSFAYDHLEPERHIALYTGLTLRGLPALAAAGHEAEWSERAGRALAFLDRLEDPETGLWEHAVSAGRRRRYPLFVAGAGMICNGILDAAPLAGIEPRAEELARHLLRFQHQNGAIRNFVGYDHPDNGRRRGRGEECWEDVVPTPNWNAQAFEFLARVIEPPEPPIGRAGRSIRMRSRRYVYAETRDACLLVSLSPAEHAVAALLPKRRRLGFVLPGPRLVVRGVVNRLERIPAARRILAGLRGGHARR